MTIDDSNDVLTLSVNNDVSVTLQLTQQTYATAEDLRAEIQAQIDGNNALNAAGVSVQADLDGSGRLVFTSSTYGSDSSVTLVSADDAAAFGLDTATAVSGVDVAGTIDGVAAEGDGQVLYLSSGQGGASGLQVRILGDQTGSRGSITFVEGVAERTVDLITSMVGADGLIEAKTNSLSGELERIAESQARLEERMDAYRARLVAQFTAADSLISQLNSTGDYVTQQLAALAPQNNRNNS
jgi:flagellar hook-associated protein 2